MVTPLVPLTYYCTLILAASVAGGMIPGWFKLNAQADGDCRELRGGDHVRRRDAAPLSPRRRRSAINRGDFFRGDSKRVSVRAGRLACDVPDRTLLLLSPPRRGGPIPPAKCTSTTNANHSHHHELTWTGAAVGLTLHSVLAGVALAASVLENFADNQLAGLATFLVIFLHKPFDSMTIGMLMAQGGWSNRWRHVVNALFALAIPAGAALFYFGFSGRCGRQSQRRLRACLLGRHFHVHLAQRSAAGAAIP